MVGSSAQLLLCWFNSKGRAHVCVVWFWWIFFSRWERVLPSPGWLQSFVTCEWNMNILLAKVLDSYLSRNNVISPFPVLPRVKCGGLISPPVDSQLAASRRKYNSSWLGSSSMKSSSSIRHQHPFIARRHETTLPKAASTAWSPVVRAFILRQLKLGFEATQARISSLGWTDWPAWPSHY